MNLSLKNIKIYFYGLTQAAIQNREILRLATGIDIGGYIDDLKGGGKSLLDGVPVLTLSDFAHRESSNKDSLILVTSYKSFHILRDKLFSNSLEGRLIVDFPVEDVGLFRAVISLFDSREKIKNNWCFGQDVAIGSIVALDANAIIGDKVTIGDRFSSGSNTVIDDRVSIGNEFSSGDSIRIGISSSIADSVKIGTGVTIGKNCELRYSCVLDNHVQIEDNVSIGENTTIGNFSHVNRNTILDADVEIGKFCSVANGCMIGAGSHQTKCLSTHRAIFYDNHQSQYGLTKKTKIGNDVWIGANCIIKDGVIIGDGAVIGACSFVSKDVPAYSISYGVPATVRSYRFNEDIINRLKELRWWDISGVESIEMPFEINSAIEYLSRLKVVNCTDLSGSKVDV